MRHVLVDSRHQVWRAGEQASAKSLCRDVAKKRLDHAQAIFNRLVEEGRIEWSLRADRQDDERPMDKVLLAASCRSPHQRPDARTAEKSLLEPALRTADMQDLRGDLVLEGDWRGTLEQRYF